MYEYRATLDRVVDGDTVDVNVDLGFKIQFRERFRLLGIDAPETRTKDQEEKTAGLVSKEFLVRVLNPSEGKFTKFVIRTHKDKKGKYGRYIGEIIISESVDLEYGGTHASLPADTNLNEELVRRGLAVKVDY